MPTMVITDARVVTEGIWQATNELRWNVSPTPGEKPVLEQKWITIDCDDEEWRPVPRVCI